jgi:hypothetical protein
MRSLPSKRAAYPPATSASSPTSMSAKNTPTSMRCPHRGPVPASVVWSAAAPACSRDWAFRPFPGLGPIVAAGWLAATAVGALTGAATGGIVGALVGAGVSEKDAHVYSESVRRGGTLVSVRTKDADAARVQAILDRYKPNRPGGARHRVSPGRMDDLRSQPAGLSAQRRGHRPYTSPRVI